MLQNLTAQPADKILELVGLYKADPRDQKIDLGVGVYKDASGHTPVMKAVKLAEEQLWQTQDSKSYTGLAGDPGFSDAMKSLVLGDGFDHVAAAATPGGTGAVHKGFELIRMANPDARVWVSNPTWPNHLTILKHLGMEMQPYAYFDAATCGVDFDGMMVDLQNVAAGDVVLLHGCCHNPTGANLNPAEEDALIALLQDKGAQVMVDIAYQGFGDGLDQDAQFTRKLARSFDGCLIAASCSKNFGIYRERTGLLMAVAGNDGTAKLAQGTMAYLNRQNYSFPPDHGARVVTTIMQDDALRANWQAELEAMRLGMLDLRTYLADCLRTETGSDRFGFLAAHRGMFSRLGITADEVLKLREDHAVYIVGDSRMNIAGLNRDTIPVLARAIASLG